MNLYSTESTDWFNSLPSIILAKTDGTNLLINSDDNYFNILDSNNIDEDEESYYDYEEHDHGDEVLKEIKSVYKVKKVYSLNLKIIFFLILVFHFLVILIVKDVQDFMNLKTWIKTPHILS